MKNTKLVRIVAFLLSVCMWNACNRERLDTDTVVNLCLVGNSLAGFSGGTRVDAVTDQVNIGDIIRVFMENATAELNLKWNGNSWKSYKGATANNGGSRNIIAYYRFPDKNKFYDEQGHLKLTYVGRTVVNQAGNGILEFKPLFGRLTFEVPASLNAELSALRVRVGRVLERIELSSGQQVLADNPESASVVMPIDESRVYSVVLPVGQNTVKLRFETLSGKHLEADVALNVQESTDYRVLLYREMESGKMNTTNDLLEWLRVIWGGSADETQLSKFGHKEGSQWVYKLGADLMFTDADNAKLATIAAQTKNKTTEFTGVLDGEHHVISGMKLTDNESEAVALLPKMGTTGVVRNLHLRNLTIISSSSQFIGGISGCSSGVIENCSVGTATFHINKQIRCRAGGLVGHFKNGEILNSGVMNVIIDPDNKILMGGLVGYSYDSTGSIYNSFVDQFKVTNGVGFSLSGYQKSSEVIENCAVMNCSYKFSEYDQSKPRINLNRIYYTAGKEKESVYKGNNNIYEVITDIGVTVGKLNSYASTNPRFATWIVGRNSNATFEFIP